ncbi:platelet glycoprotein VI-like [Mauremys reevesii]|uniref:platelet glycoprotein VI-like n=1 Tax=Mauremys reevesii TaxID=260615 RepID=UPI00193FFEFC|nr:platelet glycoprotein VI-like [Mauremys reevesii]
MHQDDTIVGGLEIRAWIRPCREENLSTEEPHMVPRLVSQVGRLLAGRAERDVKMRLFLYKDGIEIWELDAAGNEFTIPSARWEDAGAYSCQSHALWEPPNRSYVSDIVRIIVAETYYPKPSISLRPSGGVTLGGAVTIRCRGRRQNMRFLLYKDGNLTVLQDVEPAGDVTQFPIHDVSRRDAGSYSCYYRSKSDPPVWSYPSDPVELVVADLPAPGPSISVSPSGVITPGGAVTIRCQCWCKTRRLFLYKDGIEIRELDATGDGGEFTIPRARWEDAGFYSCRSRSRLEPPNWSDPSDFVRIVVSELRYPKPSISLRPSRGVALGGAVTVWCRGRHQNMRFLLYKFGNPNVLQDVELAGNVAEFPICNVSRRDAGSYRCCYCSKSDPPVWSEPSDPMELVIAEGTDPARPQEPHPPPTEPAGEAAPPRRLDFTHANIARLGLSAVILLILGLILAEAYYSRPRGHPRSLDLAVQRRESPQGTSRFPSGG